MSSPGPLFSSDSGGAPWRTSKLAVLACVLGLLAPCLLFSGYSFGQYGIRKFELYTGVLRAQLAANAFAFIGLSFLLSLAAILAGHVAQFRIRRRSSLIGTGWARAAYLLGYGTLIFLFCIVRIPATDWPPLRSTSEDRAIYLLESLDWSLREYVGAEKDRSFPESLDELKSSEKQRKSAEWQEGMLQQLRDTYHLGYQAGPKDLQGIRKSFSAELTPLQPGESARASFFIDETGILRWTKELRAANASDPPWRQTVAARSVSTKQQISERKFNEVAQNARQLARVRGIVSCAVAYAILHPEHGLPRNDEEIGPDKARCLPRRDLARIEEYHLTYIPGAPDAQGRVSTFRVEARPVAFEATGTVSYLADESGAVRTTRENRPATTSDPVAHSPLRPLREEIVAGFEEQSIQWLRGLNNCIGDYAQKRKDGALPAKLADMRPPNTFCGSAEIFESEIGARWGYSVAYRAGAIDARGRIQFYTVITRPLRYGETGRRNFFTDESGVIRWTGENRAAAATDPSVEPNFNPEANERTAAENVRQFWKCLENFATQQKSTGFPIDLRQLGPDGAKCLDAQLASGQKQGYTFHYSSQKLPAGKLGPSFALAVTPISHGKTGIRSFFLDETGVLRATRIHRMPRADDPVVVSLKN